MSSRTAWVSQRLCPKSAPDQPLVGWFGGHPRGVRTSHWPRCAVCGNPMCHMAQINAGPWADLRGAARMSVFICHATGGRCEDWDPWKGANRVVLHPELDDSLYDGPPTVRVYRRLMLSVEDGLDEYALMKRTKTEGLSMTDALAQIRHDKLGGGAVWLHGDQTPQSPTGQGPMQLALQLTTSLVSFDITPGGMAYVFVDPHSEEGVGCMVWQGG